MKNLITLLALCLLSTTLVAQATPMTSTAVAMNGSVSVAYGSGPAVSMGVSVSGIETTTTNQSGQIISGSFRGHVSVCGVTVPIEDLNGRISGMRFYASTVTVAGKKVRISILLGHPQDPVFGETSISDPTNPNNVGYGRDFL